MKQKPSIAALKKASDKAWKIHEATNLAVKQAKVNLATAKLNELLAERAASVASDAQWDAEAAERKAKAK
jgi:hypothetical protein